MYAFIFLVAVLTSPAFAQDEEFEGRCPFEQVSTKSDFNPFLYTADWYQIRRYKSSTDNACVRSSYTWDDNAKKFTTSDTDRKGNSIRSYGTTIAKTGQSNDAKFTFTFNGTSMPYWVVDTDYNSYAVVWTCKDNEAEQKNKQGLWVLGRLRDQDVTSIPALDVTLSKAVFHEDKLTDVDQNDRCTATVAVSSIFLSFIAMFLLKLF